VSDTPRRGAPLPPSRLLLAVSGACYLCACGVQGVPRPPRIEQPQPVKDLAVAQVGRNLQFSFTLPRLASDGERLTKPLEIEFVRAVFPAGQPSPPPTQALSPWITLGPDDVQKHRRGEMLGWTLTLSDEELRARDQSTILFAVRTLTRGFRRRPRASELSNVVQFRLLEVLRPVENLHVRTTARALELSWSAPPGTVSTYRVYRSATGKPESFTARGETSQPGWQDSEFEFGRTYFFKVTAITKEGNSAAESDDSEIVEVTPQDTFPPTAPQGLTAVYTTRAVELIWNANPEPDLSGYNLYRRGAGEDSRRLNPQPLRTPIFRDPAVQQGKSYAYRVTAVDLAHNESPPSRDVTVEIR